MRPDPPLDTTGRDLSSAPMSAGTALMTTDQRRTCYPQLFVGAGNWRCERITSAGLTAVDALGHWRRVWRLELGARAALAASLMDRRRRLRWRARSRLERSDRLRAAPS